MAAAITNESQLRRSAIEDVTQVIHFAPTELAHIRLAVSINISSLRDFMLSHISSAKLLSNFLKTCAAKTSSGKVTAAEIPMLTHGSGRLNKAARNPSMIPTNGFSE
jgi:hypothetical protein